MFKIVMLELKLGLCILPPLLISQWWSFPPTPVNQPRACQGVVSLFPPPLPPSPDHGLTGDRLLQCGGGDFMTLMTEWRGGVDWSLWC
jgi:hypothetical protein